MKKIENLTSEKFALSEVELNNAIAGAREGNHSFLWWSWNTHIEEDFNTMTTEVCRTGDRESVTV